MTAVLEVIGVHKTFAGIHALNNLAIVLNEGALFGLVGQNGAGKTTALNVIGGPATPDIGLIRLNGTDIGTLPVWQRAALGLGRTFQESRLWSDLTVKDHFLVAAKVLRSFRERSRSSLGDIQALTEIPDAMLGRMPGEMRLLDRRRVELALAMLNASNLLLVDEIGAGLDAEEARTLYLLIERMVGERHARAAIIVEHRLELLAAFATEIGLIEDGHIREHANSNEPERVTGLMDLMFTGHAAANASLETARKGNDRDGKLL